MSSERACECYMLRSRVGLGLEILVGTGEKGGVVTNTGRCVNQDREMRLSRWGVAFIKMGRPDESIKGSTDVKMGR